LGSTRCAPTTSPFAGQVVLIVVAVLFTGLVIFLGLIVRPQTWTRWNLRRLAEEQERLGG